MSIWVNGEHSQASLGVATRVRDVFSLDIWGMLGNEYFITPYFTDIYMQVRDSVLKI